MKSVFRQTFKEEELLQGMQAVLRQAEHTGINYIIVECTYVGNTTLHEVHHPHS